MVRIPSQSTNTKRLSTVHRKTLLMAQSTQATNAAGYKVVRVQVVPDMKLFGHTNLAPIEVSGIVALDVGELTGGRKSSCAD